MCNRTKSEVLARELCTEHYCGQLKYMPKEQIVPIKQYVEDEENWIYFIPTANRLLKSLENHE